MPQACRTATRLTLCLAAACSTLSACGGGGAGTPAPPPAATIQIGGAIRALSGTGLVLSNNGEQLAVSAGADTFRFPTRLSPGAGYRVAIVVHPNGQLCEVANAGGTAASGAQAAISIDCKTAVLSTLAGRQSPDEVYTGPGPEVSFPLLTNLAADAAGTVYVTGPEHRSVRKLSPSGMVSFHAGHLNAVGRPAYGMDDGPASSATFSTPDGIAADRAGNLYVADFGRIRKVGTDGTVTTLAGSEEFGEVDGRGAAARFPGGPANIAAAPDGSLYVFPLGGTRIRKVAQDGLVTTLAGGGAPFADGVGANAGFRSLMGIVVDGQGDIYVSDGNKIRKVSPAGAVATVFDPPPRKGCAPQEGIGPGPTGACMVRETPVNGPKELATLATPHSLALDSSGNLFIADTANGMIRVLTPQGGVSTLAGTGALRSADGPGASATLILPVGIARDGSGNLYLAEMGSWAAQTYPKIRKISWQ